MTGGGLVECQVNLTDKYLGDTSRVIPYSTALIQHFVEIGVPRREKIWDAMEAIMSSTDMMRPQTTNEAYNILHMLVKDPSLVLKYLEIGYQPLDFPLDTDKPYRFTDRMDPENLVMCSAQDIIKEDLMDIVAPGEEFPTEMIEACRYRGVTSVYRGIGFDERYMGHKASFENFLLKSADFGVATLLHFFLTIPKAKEHIKTAKYQAKIVVKVDNREVYKIPREPKWN